MLIRLPSNVRPIEQATHDAPVLELPFQSRGSFYQVGARRGSERSNAFGYWRSVICNAVLERDADRAVELLTDHYRATGEIVASVKNSKNSLS